MRDVAGITMDFAGIERLVVNARGSADAVTVGTLGGTALRAVDVDLSAQTGGGDGAADTVTALGTPKKDDVNVGSSGGDEVVTGLAARVSVVGGGEPADVLKVATAGGNDVITGGVSLSGPPVTADGGDGTDTVSYRGTPAADTIGIARTGTDLVGAFTPAGALMNVAAVEGLVVQALGGNDDITRQNGIGSLTHLTIHGPAGGHPLPGRAGRHTPPPRARGGFAHR